MSIEIPESFKLGIKYAESLDLVMMTEWLQKELHEQVHFLAGQADDYPVQAIINHYSYLSPETQKRFSNAIEALILNWKYSPETWGETAVQALLSLATELPVPRAKLVLLSVVNAKTAFAQLAVALRPAILGAIASGSTNDDRLFWRSLPVEYPEFAGMAFQVLARIAHEDAITLLGRLPQDDRVIGSVARKLPDFVSQFEAEGQAIKLRQISRIFAVLPEQIAAPLKLALKESGLDFEDDSLTQPFDMDTENKNILAARAINPEADERSNLRVRIVLEMGEKKKFAENWRSVRKLVKPSNSLGKLYARIK